MNYLLIDICRNLHYWHSTDSLNIYWKIYTRCSIIIYPGSWVSNFAGNLRAQKVNKAQTNRANILGIQCNLRGSTWIGFNFFLTFLLLYICANSHLFPSPWQLPAVVADVVCRWNTVSNTAGQDIVVGSAILRPILWAGRFFVGRSSAGDGSIEASVSDPPSGTP